MAYVSGRGLEWGLRIGDSMQRQQREKRYQEDRARAERDAEARSKLFDIGMEKVQGDALAGIEGRAQEGYGPPTAPAAQQEEKLQAHFARIREVAKGMRPENQERYLEEQKQLLVTERMKAARKRVAKGIQDRRATGAYNFLDETETSPEVDARLDMLMEALDSDQVDPMKAAESEAKLLEVVAEENKRRMGRQRVTQMIDKQLTAAVDTNPQLAEQLEGLKAMWMTGQLEPDDAIQRLFEAQRPKQTRAAGGGNPLTARTKAIEMWQANVGEARPPSEQELRPYLEAVTGERKVPTSGPDAHRQRQLSEAEMAHVRAWMQERGYEGGGAPATAAAPAAAPEGGGGLPIQPWTALKPLQQKKAIAVLEQAMRTGQDLEKVARGLGIDLETLPDEVIERLELAGQHVASAASQGLGAGVH